MYDVIIIGKGPSGISAALYTKRANISTLVIGKDKGALEKAEKIDNYYGISISGKEMAEKGIEQAINLGIKVLEEEVLNITYEDYFTIKTNKNMYEAKCVLLATGTKRDKPKIKGIKEFEGKGVSYCAICDGFFYKNKDVAVLGDGEYALNEAMELLPIANSVTLLTNGKEAKEIRSDILKIDEREIREFRGENSIQSVEFIDNHNIDIQGVFVAEGIASSTDFARKLGAQIQGNYIKVNENMQTNIPGLYAAGDCIGGLLQVSKAVSDGAKAGTEIIKFLRGKNKWNI